MKKYNKNNHTMILLGIIIPILTFFIVMNITYAYFTSQTATGISAETSKLSIQFSDDSNMYANSQIVSVNTLVLPGDELNAIGSVENVGNVQAYVVIKFEVSVKKFGETASEMVDQKFYSFLGTTLKEITQNNGSYSNNAFVLNANASQSFDISYELDFNKFDNDYQKAIITYNIQACAIQTTALTGASEATSLLIEKLSNQNN